ncbi:MAG: hypothetical protein WDO24_07705 [Pseudomonadota bacterium]
MNRKQRRAAGKPAGPSAGTDAAPGNAMIDRQFALAMQNLQSGRARSRGGRAAPGPAGRP